MSLQRDVLKSKLPAVLPNQTLLKANDSGIKKQIKRRRDYTPSRWDGFFQEKEDVRVGNNVFRVYTAGKDGAVLLLLHGGGHSGLSWAVFTAAMTEICNCRILAVDLRGHGHSKTEDDADLQADVMAKDVADVVKEYFGEDPPPIVMLGHSMGGAVAVHVAKAKSLPSLVGLVVIDVVEGTALQALSSMEGFLRSRPQAFRSLEEAIEWSIRSNQVRNLASAKVSIPGQLYRCTRVKLEQIHKDAASADHRPTSSVSETISEEELGDEIVIKEQQEHSDKAEPSQEDENMKQFYTWRIDLSRTEVFWKGWFQDMSKLFLSCNVPKLLILAGVDRLDKDLTIGQMQGKFQMHVLPNCGHTVHEDDPGKVAEIIMEYLTRNKIATAKDTYVRHMPAC